MIAMTVVSALVAICVRHYKLSEQQRETVEAIKRLAGSNNTVVYFLYDDYAKWSDETGQYQMIAPDDVDAPNGVASWIKKRFGIHVLYRPVVIMYDFRDIHSELKLTNETAELIRSLPIREIRLSKSSYMGAEMFNMLTDDEYANVAELFPEHVVVKVPDELYPEG